MEEKSSKVVREAKGVGEKMEKDVGVAESDVDKSLEAVKKEIDGAARKIPLPKRVAGRHSSSGLRGPAIAKWRAPSFWDRFDNP